MAVLRPDLMMKCVVPVIMAGIIAIVRAPSSTSSLLSHPLTHLFVSTAWSSRSSSRAIVSPPFTSFPSVCSVDPVDVGCVCSVASPMPLYTGFIQLGAGLSVGLAGLAAGFAIGIVGDAGVRGTAQQPRLFVGMVSPTASSRLLR